MHDIASSEGWTDHAYVQSLEYPGDVLVSNAGGNSIYVTYLEFYWDTGTGSNQQIAIDQSIPVGETKIFRLDYLEDRRPDLPTPSRSEIDSKYFWLSNSTGKAPLRIWSESSPHGGGKCVIRSLISKNHPEYMRVSEHYQKYDRQKLMTMGVVAYIDWTTAKQISLIKTRIHNVVTAFRFSPNTGCVQQDWDGDHETSK
jgi:hypothetical protein